MAMRRSLPAFAHVLTVVARYGRDRLAGYPRGTRIANGNGLVAALLAALNNSGVAVETGSRGTGLIVDNGRVTGVEVLAGRTTRRIAARRGVVLAAGGFAGGADWRARYFPHVAAGKAHHSLAPVTNTGDGLSLALAVGAAISDDLAEPAAWTPVSLVPMADGSLVPFPHYIDRGRPGVIAVTRHGRRFTNEAESYHRFVPAMIAACRDEPQVEVFLIADHRAVRAYGLGAAPPAPARIAPLVRSGYLALGTSLADLARQLDIDPPTLEATVAAFNGPAARGRIRPSARVRTPITAPMATLRSGQIPAWRRSARRRSTG